MGDAVPQFASFMDGSWCFRGAVAADAARKRELPKERAHPINVLALVGVNLGICTLKVDGTKHARCTVAGAGQEDGVQVIFLDQAVEVNISEAQTGTGAPMTQ